MTLSEALATWAAGLRLEEVPKAAQDAACRHMLDGVGTAIAAIRTGAAAPSLLVTQGTARPAGVRLLGPDDLPSQMAAFGLAAAMHALDFDDTHPRALLHPTAVVLPAVLAVGRELGSNGAELLEAALVGYEVALRLGSATPFGFHAAGTHATSVVGAVAAAGATAKLLRIDPPAFADALAIAASVSGGLLESLGTGTKQLHPAFAASNGIMAARLALAGADGAATIFEGGQGVFAVHSAREYDLSTVTADLGTRWEVTQISIKPYPCCQLIHATLDAALALPRDLTLDDITKVDVYAHPDSLSVVGKTKQPCDPTEAKFSLAWTTAAMLVDGAVTIDTYTPESMGRADIAALAQRFNMHDLPSAEVAASGPARIVVDIGTAAAEASVRCSKGTPSNPLSLDELRRKFYANCGGPSDSAVQVAAWVLSLPSQGKVDDFERLTDEILAIS